MLGWFKKRSQQRQTVNPRAVVEAAINATQKYGGILEDNPDIIVFDSKVLPLPKEQMKTALRIAWSVANSEQRGYIEGGYLSLSMFQDDVGDKPIKLIDSSSIDSMDLSDMTKVLSENNFWNTKTSAEMQKLRKEFDDFTRNAAQKNK